VCAPVWLNVPTIVPEVNGELSVSGESIESVLVIVALEGVAVYAAKHVGFVIAAPISSEPPQPVKEVIEKDTAGTQLMIVPDALQVYPPISSVSGPVSEFRDDTPLLEPPLPPTVK